MKLRCDACEMAEAEVLCCADEAVLCAECDKKVHSANKLAIKHHRVSLHESNSSCPPRCDTCSERKGYLFCVEDRKFLCKQCDISTHVANSGARPHQRYLITGVQVSLQSLANATDYKASNGACPESWPTLGTDSFFSRQPQVNETKEEVAMDSSASSSRIRNTTINSPGEPRSETEPEWPTEDILGSNVFHCYDFSHDRR